METIGRIRRQRRYNRRFLVMCNHYLIESTACTPASGWEKGQVENQIGNVRACAHPEQAERKLIELWDWGARGLARAVLQRRRLGQPTRCRKARGPRRAPRQPELLDRLTHRCDIVETGNDSYRFKKRK